MATLGSTIAKYERVRAKLASPREFFKQHLDDWRALAQTVVEQVLVNSRPEALRDEVWHRRTAATAARVSARLMRADAIGAVVSLALRDGGYGAEGMAVEMQAAFSVEEVERWVAAGVSKENADAPGKNLDGRDAGKDAREIAWTVLTAIRNKNKGWDGLTKAINDFLESEADDVAEGLYPSILDVWVTVFVPEVRGQWGAWVRDVLQNG